MTSDEDDKKNADCSGRVSALEKSLALIMSHLGQQNQVLDQTVKRLDKLERATGLIAEAAMKSADNENAAHVWEGFSNASKIFPKNRTVIFWGRDYFGDNIKYAYLDFYEYAEKNDIECFFVTYQEQQYQQLKAAGLPCLPRKVEDWTAQDTKTVLGAKVLVLCNVFYPVEGKDFIQYALTRGAKTIQMWHGVPLKEIGLECMRPPTTYGPRNAEVLGASGVFDVFVGGSMAAQADWAGRFSFDEYAAIGYPRTDVFFRELAQNDLINVDVNALGVLKDANQNKRPVIVYAPTFRDHKMGAWIENSKIEVLAKHCKSQGYVFYVNLHPFEQEINAQLQKHYPCIECISAHTDIYPILKYTDVLVTDYSSLAVDFLLRDKPMVFYTPDHDEYVDKARGLIPGYEQYMAGERVCDIDALIKAVDGAVGFLQAPDADIYAAAREAVRQKTFDHNDGLAAQRLRGVIAKALDKD
ncbi:MAG: CDP-glycerol glycerophosphotransferase family protein [Alphaproteobacteria bacterium]|nr:CDP-glycerol glycerophosphotransferase family protein [Alphaproteobacteria bacterium]